MYYLKDRRIWGIGIVLISVIGISLWIFVGFNTSNEAQLSEKLTFIEEKEDLQTDNFYIDVKGAVKDPGVYLVSDGERVIDAIEKAGGLKKNANTANINLSQRLKSEMVVFVYTDKEVKKGEKTLACDTECNCDVIEINNCIETNETSSSLININKASIEELMGLSGVGESKAKAIVTYREENGEFKSIDDIKKVSGIGDSLYEDIKEKITV